MATINSIHEKLGLNATNGLYVKGDANLPFMKKLEKLYSDVSLQPDSAFCLGDKPFILFYENPSDKEKIFKAIWNLNEVPIVIIADHNTINIYNGFEYLKTKSSLALIGSENLLNDFEYFKLVTGETWEKYEKQLSYKNRVDFKLLENIKDARELLISSCGLNNHTANALLGKSIFTRYLIDRKVRIGFDSNSAPKEWTTKDFCQILSSKKNTFLFFKYLDDTFNGDLFEFEESSNNISQNALNILIDLLNGVTLKTGQLSLFDVFDFSIIPVEFISNVYELFIGQEEQAESGAYYTPLFLVEYITSQTVKDYLKKNSQSYNCKILDPACGSGIFLVEALRAIIERYNVLNPELKRDSNKYRSGLTQLVKNNIYGVDKDASAVSVAIFSVYLTLLDYQNPRDIETFKFPKLLNENLFTSDFFDLQNDFNKSLKKIKFDFIIGNPPWKRGSSGSSGKQPFEEYIISRKKQEGDKGIAISNKEIAQAFLLRVSDFSQPDTKTALIVTSKTLYNINAKSFRKYFLDNYLLEKVFELSPVRREVFNKSNDPAIAPAVVLFYKFAFNETTDSNELLHYSIKPSNFFSLFNLFVIHRNDVKNVKQTLLKQNDWLWKTLLYGNYLDYYFLLRLSQYPTIEKRIKDKQYLKGQGFQIGADKNPVGELSKLKVLSHEKVTAFLVHNDLKPFKEKTLHRIRDEKLYYGTRLLIKKGLNIELKSVAAICYKNCLFKDTITAIRVFKKNDINDLRLMSGLLQSDLFSYYALHKFSSVGVEREQSFNEEKFSFPFIESAAVSNAVENIEAALIKNKSEVMERPISKSLFAKLNTSILKSFHLNSIESALVDYTLKFSVPNITRKTSYTNNHLSVSFEDDFIEEYIEVFNAKFSNLFGENKSFQIEVWHSNHIIGIIFKITSNHPNSVFKPVDWKNKSNDELMKFLISFGHERITDKLFIQKDIRGFEKNSFYIFKPNEKKAWHKAMAYVDLNDFYDAILKAGKKA